MSSDETQSPLARAYDLVEAGQYDEARAVLDAVLAEDEENADAWWIYAHAVTDVEMGRQALENVLRIDPNYPGAAELLEQADEMSEPTPKPDITPLSPTSMPEAPDILPEDEFPEPEPVSPQPAQRRTAKKAPAPPPAPRRSPFPVIAVVAIIVIALVLLILLLQTGNPPPAATPTAVSALATGTDALAEAVTEQPTEVMPTDVPTAEQATAEVAEIDFASIETALAEFPIAESGVGVVDTSLGATLMVSACTTPGRAMRTLLPQVMNALAGQSPSLGADIAAIGARMLDCTENTALVTVATDLASAQNYAQGNLSDSDFAAMWKPQ